MIFNLIPPAPTPEEVRGARLAAGLSQPQMAELLACASHRTVQAWESGQNPPDLARWALFLLATGQHSQATLKRFKPA